MPRHDILRHAMVEARIKKMQHALRHRARRALLGKHRATVDTLPRELVYANLTLQLDDSRHGKADSALGRALKANAARGIPRVVRPHPRRAVRCEHGKVPAGCKAGAATGRARIAAEHDHSWGQPASAAHAAR